MKMSFEACVAEINLLIAIGVVRLSAPSSLLMRGDVVAPLLGISYETSVYGGRINPQGWMCLKIDGEVVSTHLPGAPDKSPASLRAGYRKFFEAVQSRMAGSEVCHAHPARIWAIQAAAQSQLPLFEELAA